MSVTVCIPTLNSYETLTMCVDSIRNSSIQCSIAVIDNGGIVDFLVDDMTVMKPPHNLGVAASWNWFIDNVPNQRIICNDDIIFTEYALEQLLYAYNENNIISPENLESHFSCFLLPQHIIDVVGLFDETLSPRYAYFEDNDYFYRMNQHGFSTTKAPGSIVQHVGSSTLKHYNIYDETKHHQRFKAARDRYVMKWGGKPGEERYKTPYNRKP